MAVKLYAHNQTAYEKALHLMEQSGRAAVVHPTGTGKSFIAFKLAEEHPGERIIWLAPSEYIFRSQRENYIKAGGDEEALSGITFLTYSKLMYGIRDMEDTADDLSAPLSETDIFETSLDQAFLSEPPAYIVLDEFHRCGAESWGRCVHRLMQAFPEAKVLGLSATNIRYLDNRRDMAGELFDGRLASRMELAEAISRGILPAPFYVCGLYEYRDELRKLSTRVNRQRNAGVRDESVKLLNKLRHCLEQADGPAEIFARYMKKDGKYIVFCSGREHMEEMISLAATWYGALDKTPTVYRAIYDNMDSPEEVKNFTADQSDHLKLLFCIDMLNEGVHVADVDGAVLLRPTASPTLYLQQVGRALSVPDRDRSGQPMIFDMVDNFDSLKCIDSFLEAYHKADKGQKSDRTKKTYTFRLVDEARESRELFEKLNRALASSWEVCYQEAKHYYEIHGNLKIPKYYITESGISLGSWLITQRRVRAGAVPGKLTEEQISELDHLGMEWENRIGKAWETGYQQLVAYFEVHGHVDVPGRYVTEDGYPLGKFVANQRLAAKADSEFAGSSLRPLSPDRRKKLQDLGFIWNKANESFGRYYEAATVFYRQEGHLNVPAKYTTPEGLRLGEWLRTKAASRDTLPEEQVQALEAIGMTWGGRYDAKWEEKYRLAKEYYEEHGNLDVPKDYTVQGVRLGRWVNALRSAAANPTGSHYRLTPERISQLEAIGMRWAEDSWEVRYRLAQDYLREHGDLKIPQNYVVETEDGRIWLGKWVASQRKKMSGQGGEKALTEEQVRRLREIGVEK
ncbi:MAG: Helicase associated domain protein [Acetatifactor sp.]